MDFVAGLGALLIVSVEWGALGWLSGVTWPRSWSGNRRGIWALRILAGAALVASAQLVLAAAGLGFGALGEGIGRLAPMVLTLAVAALAAAGLRRVTLGGTASTRRARVSDPARRGVAEPVADDVTAAPRARLGGRSTWARVGWAALAAVVLAAVVRSLLMPELGWDAYSHWGLRAQAYAMAGTVVNAGSEHDYYPPLVPLLEAWFDLHLGRVSLDLSKSVWAVTGGAFAICLTAHLHNVLRAQWLAPWLAIGIVLITSELLDGFFSGQADLPMTAFLTLATLACWHWTRDRNREWLVHAGVFAAAAALCKLEGGPRLAVVALAIGADAVMARERDIARPIAVLAVAIALPAVIWTAVANAASISPNSEHLGALQAGAALPVMAALIAVFRGIRTGGGLVIAALAWMLAGAALLRQPARVLTLVAIGEVAATLLGFLTAAGDPVVQVRTSATRLVAHILPLVLITAIVAIDASVGWSGAETYNRREPG
ncbi:MAG: hypothetical protein NVSMB2_24240 [Chloroflexota bacterium]